MASADEGWTELHRTNAESDALQKALTGTLVSPGSAEYAAACRGGFNSTSHDKRPVGFVFCENINDVVHAINFARKNHPHVVVRSNGHTNRSIADGALVLDLSRMKTCRVWNSKKLAIVQPGCTFGEINDATLPFGLAVPGPAPSCGVASAALGGGKGLLTRQYGLTLDNLIEVEIVTTDGKVEKASAGYNRELFWAVRGGSGFVGVVTQFLFKCESVATPNVLAGQLVFPVEWAKEALFTKQIFEAWMQVKYSLPAESSLTAMLCTPPADLELRPPMSSRPIHKGSQITGQDSHYHSAYSHPCLIFTCFHNGPLDEVSTMLFDPLINLGPAVNTLSEMPYSKAAALNEFDTPCGERYHHEGGVLQQLTHEVLSIAVKAVRTTPNLSVVFGDYTGGAVERTDAQAAMVYPHRAPEVDILLRARWTNKQEDEKHVAGVADLHANLQDHLTGAAEINSFVDAVDEVAAFGPQLMERLAVLRREYDPSMLLMCNHP
eukprot:TRINITY_DN18682_c0_g1_i1.p1 TRINITY_DN18682_c0_g1~~TRINITY_DN18682_c0_g1_i1.p1  ORF type:complete len:493 (+),score=135.71 TRINITY_DN18682_c0_g1_i1:153-1631(+)